MLAEVGEPRRDRVALGASSNRRASWKVTVAGVCAVALLTLAGCSSSGSKKSSTSSTSPQSTASSAPAAGSSAPAATNAPAGVTAAKKTLAPYLVKPTSFPVSQPLTSKLPAGKKFVYLQCGTPICAQVGGLLEGAVKAIGAKMTVVNAGTTAQTAQAAASSAVALKPDAVLLGAIDPALFGGGLKALAKAGAKLVSLQVDKDVKQFGITFNYLGTNLSEQNGKLMADWVIANEGPKANAVLYTLPALAISAPVQSAFQAEMKANCPSCTVRTVPIDVSTIGTTAPRTIVTDLQAHKGTTVAVFVSLSAAGGLPAALQAAGLKIAIVGFGPTAGNLQDIKDGKITSALDIDFPVSTWTAVDAAARLIEGGQPTASEQAGAVPEQFLEQKDITFSPTTGWSAFPDFPLRFAKLWHTS